MRRTDFDQRGRFRSIVVVHLRAEGLLLADAGSDWARSRALIYQRRRQIIDVEP
jgi:hypothetical protein